MKKHLTAKFKWKCRNCGVTYYDGLESSSEIAEHSLTDVVIFGKSSGRGHSLLNLTTHFCNKKQVGIADLVGYDLE